MYLSPFSGQGWSGAMLLLGRKGVAPAESYADPIFILSLSVIIPILWMREPRQAKVGSLAKVSERISRRTQIRIQIHGKPQVSIIPIIVSRRKQWGQSGVWLGFRFL